MLPNIAEQLYLNLKLDSCLYSINSQAPSPSNYYLKILLESTKLFMNDDYEVYKSNRDLEDDLLKGLEKLSFDKKNTTFLKSEIKLQWAILKLKNSEEFSAFWNLKQAYTLAKENTDHYPEYLPSYKTLGLLNVLYGIFPDRYHWILSILGIEGDVDKGLKMLDKAKLQSSFLYIESSVTQALLHTYLLNHPQKAVEIIDQIHEENDYLIINYAQALILMKNAQSDLVIQLLKDVQKNHLNFNDLPQLYYLLGEAYLQKGDPEQAIRYYQVFLSIHNGTNLVKDANYKIGVSYFVQNSQDSVSKYFNIARAKGWAKNEADKNAKQALESNIEPNLDLMQIRYATDGGFYQNAFKTQGQIDTTRLNIHDKCEYIYRSARLYHKTDETDLAIMKYKRTIDIQQQNDWYYAPNSALQLGLIYLKRKDNENAEKYLSLVNSYHGYTYQNSIRQKTKSAKKELD